jgi:hypothetical protein
MHIGRAYPWIPAYYATECQFWPGYVPWKFWGTAPVLNPHPWDGIPTNWAQLSGQGDTVVDCTQAFWDLPIPTPSPLSNLALSIEMEVIGGKRYAVWKAIVYTFITPIASAWYFLSYPQYSCAVPVAQWWSVHDPLVSPTGPWLGFRPATYEEGGSPWD